VAATRIFREDPPRVTVSHNRLGLYQTRIRYGIVAKINVNRKSQTCEDLGQILVDHSRTCRASLPHLALPRPGEASERTHMFLSFSSPPHSYKFIESNPLFK
jgi:hypothetical protein